MSEGVDVVRFYPCSTSCQIDSPSSSYSPVFTHHFFPIDFKFSAFKDLNVRIFYSTNSFHTAIDIYGEFGDISEEESRALLLDLERALFLSVPFPGGFISKSQLATILDNSKGLKFHQDPIHKSFVDDIELKIHSIRIDSITASSTTNNTVESTDVGTDCLNGIRFSLSGRRFTLVNTPNSDENNSDSIFHVHRRIEWHCHWFIESMSNIIYDKSWEIFFPIVFTNRGSKCTSSTCTKCKGSNTISHLIGIATCYHFFTLDRTRFRISQFLILPQWQRLGFGTGLLKVIYDRAISDPGIREIAVEDPSPDFSTLRDLIGLKLCIENGLISKNEVGESGVRDQIVPVQVNDIINACKESKSQASRLAEIIMLASVKEEGEKDCLKETFSMVRLKTKKRIKVEQEELLASAGDNYKEVLARMWEERFNEYSKTITKIRKT